jgi:hypothetical protein
LLSQVDVLLYRETGDIGSVALELWPVVAGGPAGSTPLFSVPISPSAIPTAAPTYVPINVAAGGIHVSPGEQYAIAINGSAEISAQNAIWSGGFPGYSAGGLFDRSGVWEFGSTGSDYGFRTWVDSAIAPTGLSTLALTPTSEWDASLSTSGSSVIFSAGDSMRVDRAPAFDDDDRGLMEYDASGLPEGAIIRSATLDFDINQRSQNGATVPAVAAYGYQADGSPTDADARTLSRFLGQSVPIQNFDPVTIALDASQISSMHAASPGIGIIAYEAVPNVGVSIVATQLANQFPTVYSPPTLTLGYSVPSYPAQSRPVGDYNADAHVDAADYVVWRKHDGTTGNSPADGDGDNDVDHDDFDVWRAAYGTRPDDEVANGDFQTGNLSDWNVVVEPNTNVTFGFPRVESFDVDGDAQASSAMRVRLGRSNTSLFGGTVALEQEILLAAGDYLFSADVAAQSLQSAGNSGPGNFELTFDGKIVDQVMLNGTSIAGFQVIRDSLQATLANVEPGYHTLRLAVSRGATNTREIYQFIDNIQLTPIAPASASAVPEPSGAILLGVSLALAAPCGRVSPRRGIALASS